MLGACNTCVRLPSRVTSSGTTVNSFFVVAASGREGCVLSSFCFVFFFFLLSFCRGKGYFILGVDEVRDSSSAGQSLTYVSIVETDISFEGGCKGLAVI